MKPAIRRFLPPTLLVVLSTVLSLAAAEVALRLFAPVSLVTIGHRFCDNAARYGWGFGPHERIVLWDPDTGAEFADETNAAGWRDRDHAPGRAAGVFRVLVLGDSVTYGAIVGADDLYTRVLERKLGKRGYAVEVISLALGRWGTDQELEALRLEGLSYAPDLVIVEFTGNDPGDIFEPLQSGLKPFAYEIGPDGGLVRRENPYFLSQYREELKELRWRRLRDRFEILKRGSLLAERFRNEPRETPRLFPGHGGAIPYSVTDWGIETLSLEFGVAADSELTRWLRARVGQTVTREELRRSIAASTAAGRVDEALRAFEHHWFTVGRKRAVVGPVDPEGRHMKLLRGLLDEMHRLSSASGARFLLFSTHEQGHYDWDRYWFHVPADDATREAYLSWNPQLRNWADSRGVDFVVPDRPIARARNDPHPSKQGNAVMAEALAQHLESRYGAVLPRRAR
jgi:lysophospholipase L1-like esterase